MMTLDLRRSIKRTINYGNKFGARYDFEEISFRLIGKKTYRYADIKDELIKNGYLDIKNDSQSAEKKLVLAKKLARKIKKRFKTVILVGVTGSVAAGYPKDKADIDLMVITKNSSLWWTRLLIRLWVKFNGIPHRKYNIPEKGNDFCFNLWLEENSLEMPRGKQNLRNAMDLILMKPIINKNNIYENFLSENKWSGKYVANGYGSLTKNIKNKKDNSGSVGNLIKILNLFSYLGQYWYMKGKINKEIIDLNRAFFHPTDKSAKI